MVIQDHWNSVIRADWYVSPKCQMLPLVADGVRNIGNGLIQGGPASLFMAFFIW